MGILDRFFKKKVDYDVAKVVAASARAAMLPTTRARETSERWEKQFFWYEGIIPRNEMKSRNVMETLKVIRDANPDASMAVWNFLRLANSSHELEVKNPNGKVDKRATDYCNDLAREVGKLYGGGVDQLINVLLLTAYTSGAIALEVELNDSLNEVVDFHAVDPISLDFRRNKETGEIELVQKQSDGTYKVLNQEQVFYFPLDPDVSDPHGRSPLLPILQIVFFQIEVLKDLKKVIHHQGHQRFDIKVLEEAVLENMPAEISHQGPEAVRDFVSGYVADIRNQMQELEPDDDFFHLSSVEIDMVGGAMGNSMDATRVIDIINQQVVTALKQLPILLGRNEGSTETHSTVQWQIYVKGIESVQRAVKRLLERAYNLALQINGMQGKAHLTFDKLAVSDRLKDAQAEEVETRTKVVQVQQGWITNDQAAMEQVGQNAVAEPMPIAVPASNQTPAAETEEEENEEQRSFPKKKSTFRVDGITDSDYSYVKPLEKIEDDARKAFKRLLRDQRNTYIERLKEAPDVPTDILMEARTLRMIRQEEQREEKPEPPLSLVAWVNTYITHDTYDQIEMWVQEGREWIENAAVLAGMESLIELDLEMEFNATDTRLVRWIAERSRRSAELIQGVSDESVLMELWDVVYEGKYTIPKAAKALQDSFAFSPARAERIARTEIISAGRSGQFHGDLQSGIVIGKKWRAADQPGRTREGHLEANDQVVAFDQPFYVANGQGQVEALMFPGDTSLGATASNVIQCRCFYTRILEGEEM